MTLAIPENLEGKELFAFLKKNKSLLINQKKSQDKHADCVRVQNPIVVNRKGDAHKDAGSIPEDATKLAATLVINTCNWYDSHGDVHIPGIWKKNLSESDDQILLQEHSMRFDSVISDQDQVVAYTAQLSWKELGINIAGVTEALLFDVDIEKDRNTFMFNQYRKGYVKNHSVGMRYVKIELAINSDDEYYKDELAVWNKYYDQIANKADVDAVGYFWAVKEAKCIEGSAVVKGSNIITPTYSISSKESTETEPPASTHEQPQIFDVMEALKTVKFFN